LEDYNKSLENYAYSLKLICLINKLFAMDYVRIFHENLQDRNTRSAFIMSARDHIRHLGHVVGDKDTLSADPSLVYKYVVSLAGGENKRTKQFKEKYNFEYAAEDSVYALYEEMCWKVGVDVFCNIMDRIIIELHPDLAQRLNVQR
jgi:hypothetical protein